MVRSKHFVRLPDFYDVRNNTLIASKDGISSESSKTNLQNLPEEGDIKKIGNDFASVKIQQQKKLFLITVEFTFEMDDVQKVEHLLKIVNFTEEEIERLNIGGKGIFIKKIEPLEPYSKYPRTPARIEQRGSIINLATDYVYFEISKKEKEFTVACMDLKNAVPIEGRTYKTLRGLKVYLLENGIRKEDIAKLRF